MKRLTLILCACLNLMTLQAQAHPLGYDGGVGRDSQNLPVGLRLETTVVRECFNSEGDSASLKWDLKLTYTNTARQPILLDKKSSLIYKSFVSRSLRDATAGRYEYTLSSSFIDLRKAGVRTGVKPEEGAFVLLEPGESYSLETDYGVHLYVGDKGREGYLRPGTHFLKLRVMTWYYLDSPETYQEQWRNKGYLWSQNMTSLPMQFNVQEQRNVTPCYK